MAVDSAPTSTSSAQSTLASASWLLEIGDALASTGRRAWLPVPILLLAILALGVIDPRASYPAPPALLFAIQFLSMALPGAAIAYLMARCFLVGGAIGFLFLGCGALFFGLSGVAAAQLGGGYVNASVTIHNLCVWLSAFLHLCGVVLSGQPPRPLQERRGWLFGGYALVLGAVALVAQAAHAGWTPTFFVQGEGGTLARQIVLGSACLMFAMAAFVVLINREARLAFNRWYGSALALIAVGLFGVLIQQVHGSLLGWTGVVTQTLGGAYLLVAALTAVHDAQARSISIAAGPPNRRLRYSLAFAIVAMAVAVRLVLPEEFGSKYPFLLLYPAVILSALFGGFGPGLFAAVLAAIAVNVYWEPVGDFSWVDSLAIAVFLLISIATVFIVAAMQRASARVHAAETSLQLARERERGAEMLLASERRLAAVLEHSPVGIGMMDASGRWVMCNSIMRRFVAQDHFPQEAGEITERWFAFKEDGSPLDIGNWTAARALRGETVAPGVEFLHKTGAGAEVWTCVSAAPLRDANGGIIGAVAVVQDIDALKRAELALKEADRRKDVYLATLAHELRNPLAPIRNAVAVLRLERSSRLEIEWARDIIDRQTTQMARLLDDLLEVSRIAQGKLQLRKAALELADAVQDALETSKPLLDSRGHSVRIELPAEPVRVIGDRMRLAQVCANLLTNAAKYTEPNGRISISVTRNDAEARLTVEDNGIGIEVAMLDRVFEPFIQSEQSVYSAQGGLGIGLALVKGLVELHAGSVTAYSEGPGKGSRFEVRLPLHHAAPAPEQSGAARTTARLASMSVLVADDNRDAADSLAKILRSAGARVSIAYDGADALDVARREIPHAAVLDIGMPVINGYALARKLRDLDRRPLLVALTGWGQQSDRAAAMSAGFDHHLVKPIDPQELIALLAAHRDPIAQAPARPPSNGG